MTWRNFSDSNRTTTVFNRSKRTTIPKKCLAVLFYLYVESVHYIFIFDKPQNSRQGKYMLFDKQKVKSQNYWTLRKIQNEKFKRIDNCHIPDLVQALSNVENGWLNLVFVPLIFSLVWQWHQIPLYLQWRLNKKDIIGKIFKKGIEQSTYLVSLNYVSC